MKKRILAIARTASVGSALRAVVRSSDSPRRTKSEVIRSWSGFRRSARSRSGAWPTTESMKDALSEENGYELIFDDARNEQENQIRAIRTFIQQDVDYIVFSPSVETGWDFDSAGSEGRRIYR